MENQDKVVSISNPRLIAAIYFTLLAVLTTFGLDLILYGFGIDPFLPTFKKLILSITVSAIFGAWFGKRIIYCPTPYKLKVFFSGFLMTWLAIPCYTLGFVYCLQTDSSTLFAHATWKELCFLYLNVLGFSYVLIGIWLGAGAGLAAMYLRGSLIYYILDSRYQEFHAAKKKP